MKKILFFLICILALGLCACGGQVSPEETAPATETTAAATQPVTESATESVTEPATEPTTEPTEPEIVVPIFENDYVEIHQINEKTLKITMKGLQLKDTYLVNRKDTPENLAEYVWEVSLTTADHVLDVNKVSWAFPDFQEREVTLDWIDDSMYYGANTSGGNPAKLVVVFDEEKNDVRSHPIACSYTEDSITWQFELPEYIVDLRIYDDVNRVDGFPDFSSVKIDDYFVPFEFDIAAIEKVKVFAYDYSWEFEAIEEEFDLNQE